MKGGRPFPLLPPPVLNRHRHSMWNSVQFSRNVTRLDTLFMATQIEVGLLIGISPKI